MDAREVLKRVRGVLVEERRGRRLGRVRALEVLAGCRARGTGWRAGEGRGPRLLVLRGRRHVAALVEGVEARRRVREHGCRRRSGWRGQLRYEAVGRREAPTEVGLRPVATQREGIN